MIDAYRVLLVDAYGTLHDGRVTLPFVAEALVRARAAGRTVVIVTNSPQRTGGMVRRMESVGFPRDGYDHIACSGELAWRDLEARNGLRLDKVHFILQGAGVPWAGEVRNPLVPLPEADLLVAAGMPHPTEEEARGSPLARDLAAACARGVPMLVADSDLVYPSGGSLRLGPGWIAAYYAGLGGEVTEYGKPFDPIYDEALALAGGAAPGEVLMIGDNLATDILGARPARLRLAPGARRRRARRPRRGGARGRGRARRPDLPFPPSLLVRPEMTDDRPNVLFICADQWRADCIGALGHPHVKTPNLDALIADGVLFENHYGQCTPCGPSRTSLLTGLYLMNHRSGRNGTPLDARFTNVALEARRQGYDPTLFGYTDTSLDPRGKDPHDPAVQAYDEGVMPGFTPAVHMSEEMAPWIGDLIGKGYDLPGGRDDVFRPRAGFVKPDDRGYRYIPAVFTAEDSDAAFLTDRLLEWLQARQRRPFFAHVVFLRPHPPLDRARALQRDGPPEGRRHAAPGRDAGGGRRPAPVPEVPDRRLPPPGILRGAQPDRAGDRPRPRDPPDDGDLLRARRRGRPSPRADRRAPEGDRRIRPDADRLHLGPRRDARRALCLVEGDLLRPGLPGAPRHPRSPRRPAARRQRVTHFSEAIDVAPTIIERIGGVVPRAMDGRSLLPFLDGDTPDGWRTAVFFEHDFREVVTQRPETALGLTSDECCYAVIRDDRFKYVHFAALPPLLFDMRDDPHETTDLAGRPEMQDVLLRYASRLLTWRLTGADRTLTNMALTPDGVVERR